MRLGGGGRVTCAAGLCSSSFGVWSTVSLLNYLWDGMTDQLSQLQATSSELGSRICDRRLVHSQHIPGAHGMYHTLQIRPAVSSKAAFYPP
jgi:hypothetical protein